jgi:hypothetical protein
MSKDQAALVSIFVTLRISIFPNTQTKIIDIGFFDEITRVHWIMHH